MTAKSRSDQTARLNPTQTKEDIMNDNAFALYVLALVTAVGSLFTLAVLTGIASVPPIAFMVEHVILALAIRTAYKSFDGSNPIVDFLEFYGWKSASETAEVPADALGSAA
jgi:hypothetical protein